MLNVSEGDIAILVKPKILENQDRVCVVEQRLPRLEAERGGVWWFCTFQTNVMTEEGPLPCATLEDYPLRRLAGPSVPLEELLEDELDLVT